MSNSVNEPSCVLFMDGDFYISNQRGSYYTALATSRGPKLGIPSRETTKLIGRFSIETGVLAACCCNLCIPVLAIACHETERENVIGALDILEHIPMCSRLYSIVGDRQPNIGFLELKRRAILHCWVSKGALSCLSRRSPVWISAHTSMELWYRMLREINGFRSCAISSKILA